MRHAGLAFALASLALAACAAGTDDDPDFAPPTAVLTESDPTKLTRDLGGTAGTNAFADAVIAQMK